MGISVLLMSFSSSFSSSNCTVKMAPGGVQVPIIRWCRPILAVLAPALEKLDVLAFGILLGELFAHSGGGDASLEALARACTAADPDTRPTMAAAAEALRGAEP